jgi:hypothetical protein
VKKYFAMLLQGIGLGIGAGLCLAGAVSLLYQRTHAASGFYFGGEVTVYMIVIGVFVGTLAGWCLALQWVLVDLMNILVLKISTLVPLATSRIGGEWAGKMEIVFREVLKPLPGFFGRFVNLFLVRRFKDYNRANRSLEKVQKKYPDRVYSPEGLAQLALHYYLEPLWGFFYITYAVLFLICCFFWTLPFFR